MEKLEKIKTLDLSGTKKGKIFISKLNEPYGEKSESVASIAISLAGKEDGIDWKAHIPISNLADVIDALKTIK